MATIPGTKTIAILAILISILYASTIRMTTIMGIFKHPQPYTTTAKDKGEIGYFQRIDDTVQCEDLHWYQPANLLFAACEDEMAPRFRWWPAMGIFRQVSLHTGSLHVIDPVVRVLTIYKEEL